MGTIYYHQASEIQSKPLTRGTPAHTVVCNFLRIPADATSTLQTIEAAFEEQGWCFLFDEEKIIGLEGDDDGEMPDLEDLAPLVSILSGYVEWECEGDVTRSLFSGGMVVHSGGEVIFSADVCKGKGLKDEIKRATARLKALKVKAKQDAQ